MSENEGVVRRKNVGEEGESLTPDSSTPGSLGLIRSTSSHSSIRQYGKPILCIGVNWKVSTQTVFHVRIVLAVVCFVFLILSFLSLGVGVNYCLQFQSILQVDDENRESYAMVPIYMLIVCGAYGVITCLLGAIGTSTGDKCFLMSYSVLTTFFLFFGFILTFIDMVAYSALDHGLSHMFKDYAMNLYGTEETGIALMDLLVDNAQIYHQCCGWHPHRRPSSKSPSNVWLNVLFWMESSNWGQLKAHLKGYRNDRKWEWVPKSCCRDISDPNCNLGFYYKDRLDWDKSKEAHFANRIYSENCNGKPLNFSNMSGGNQFGFLILFLLFIVTMMFFTIIALIIFINIDQVKLDQIKEEFDEHRENTTLHRIKQTTRGHWNRIKSCVVSMPDDTHSLSATENSIALINEPPEGTAIPEINVNRLVIQFPTVPDQMKQRVVINNTSNHKLAFEVTCTKPNEFTVSDKFGIIDPQKSVNVDIAPIEMQRNEKGPTEVISTDKFTIKTTVAADDSSLTAEMIFMQKLTDDTHIHVHNIPIEIIL